MTREKTPESIECPHCREAQAIKLQFVARAVRLARSAGVVLDA